MIVPPVHEQRYDTALRGNGLTALMPIRAVCDVLSLHCQTIVKWLRIEAVTPTIRGTMGTYAKPHLFSYRTVMGLARVVAFQKTIGVCPDRLVKIIVSADENTPDSNYEALWRSRRGDVKDFAQQGEAFPKEGEAFGGLQVKNSYFATIYNLTGRKLTLEESDWIDKTLQLQEYVIIAFGLFGWGDIAQ